MIPSVRRSVVLLAVLVTAAALPLSAQPQRARDLGIPFPGTPGPWNAITDVPGVEVGYTTLIEGDGPLVPGKGPVRTGVTVILPRGKAETRLPAGWFSLNGDGELTGIPFIQDYGTLTGPIGITNTNSVGIVRDAVGEWCYRNFSTGEAVDFSFGLPVVGETWDGDLNDINGYHVRKEHVFAALDGAASGPIAEGNVGGGTGMWLYGFKGGTGTASRLVPVGDTTYTLGVLAQCNFGEREDLLVAGIPVGREITNLQPVLYDPHQDGSVIVVVATDAPLLPSQLTHLARRVTMGLARTGSIARNGSGDIFVAFSTAEPAYDSTWTYMTMTTLVKWHLDPLFSATVEAVEEAVINALIAAETMTGVNGNTLYAMPEERLVAILRKYNRIADPGRGED